MTEDSFQMKDREDWVNEHSRKELGITVYHELKMSRQHREVPLGKKVHWAFSVRRYSN